jgi:hypothetical protein
MARTDKRAETLKFSIVSRWLTVTVDGIGWTIALGVIGSLTFLSALYMYLSR